MNMKRKTYLALWFVSIASQLSHADDEIWDICTTAGYYSSIVDGGIFLGGIANQRAERRNISCLVDYRGAFFSGKETANLLFKDNVDIATLTKSQKRVFQKAVEFQEKVNDFILDGMGEK